MSDVIKICGLNDPETLEAALSLGADMVGFVHYACSPRHVPPDRCRALSRQVRGRALRVALVVDASDEELDAVAEALDPDLLQLHGSESPERVAAIRARLGRPVMKAVGIGGADDLAALHAYAEVADRLLVDAKPPKAQGALPGGNGATFDWALMRGFDAERPLMLSGGLTPDNVSAAVAATGIAAVDVSSGVEHRPGFKDPDRIAAFIRAARAATPEFRGHQTR